MRVTREDFDACRERALCLLDVRAHSMGQLRGKLLAKGFDRALVELVTDDLRRSGLVDDLQFATAFCEERVRGSRPAGPARLRAELLRRQVPGEMVEQAVSAVMAETGSDEGFELALDAGQRKWETLRSRPNHDPRKDRDRLLRFLAGRGFCAEVCYRVAEAVQLG